VNDHFLQLPLGSCSFHNTLIDGVGSDQPEDKDWFCLTNAVAAILSLKVTLWVLEY
jgi:hypothetical protein